MNHLGLHQVYMARIHFLNWESNTGAEYKLFLLPLSSFKSQTDEIKATLNSYGINHSFDVDVETAPNGTINIPNITNEHVMLVIHSPIKGSYPFKRKDLEDPYQVSKALKVSLMDADIICERIKEIDWDAAFSAEDKEEITRLFLMYASDTKLLRQQLSALERQLKFEYEQKERELKEKEKQLQEKHKEKEKELEEQWEKKAQELEEQFSWQL